MRFISSLGAIRRIARQSKMSPWDFFNSTAVPNFSSLVFHGAIGIGQIFLEFNPVDIRGIGVWIPAAAAREEEVLFVW